MEPLRKQVAAPQAVQAEVPKAIEQMAVDRYKVVPSHESMFHRWAVVAGNGTQQLYIGREVECQNMALKFAGAFLDGAFVAMQNTAPAHPVEAVQAAVPDGWKLAPIKVPDSAFAWVSGGYPAGFKAGDKRDTAVVHKRAQRTWEAILNGITAPAHPAEGVTARASEWDGKLPERLQSVLNALRLELPAAVVNDVEFEVRSHYEAMHTSLSTSRRMYGAARDRLEAIDAAQPDPFAATQPAAQGMDALTIVEKLPRYTYGYKSDEWGMNRCLRAYQDNAGTFLMRDEVLAALAAQAKQGGAANG